MPALLLEYLVSPGRQRNLVAFEAETLPEDYAMQGYSPMLAYQCKSASATGSSS